MAKEKVISQSNALWLWGIREATNADTPITSMAVGTKVGSPIPGPVSSTVNPAKTMKDMPSIERFTLLPNNTLPEAFSTILTPIS